MSSISIPRIRFEKGSSCGDECTFLELTSREGGKRGREHYERKTKRAPADPQQVLRQKSLNSEFDLRFIYSNQRGRAWFRFGEVRDVRLPFPYLFF